MSKKKRKNKQQKSMLGLCQSIRRDWNGVNPVTKIVESKKKKKPKYPHKEYEQD